MSIPPKSFVYMRHGVSDWNELRLCIGALDRPLTDRGRAQARSASAAVRALPLTEVFHSPLERAAETATLACAGSSLSLQVEPLLTEACLGDKQGCYEADPDDDFTTAWFGGASLPNAESYADLKQRAAAALTRILDRSSGLPMLVAHSAIFRAMCDVMGLRPIPLDHCRPWRFDIVDGRWVARELTEV